MAKEAFLDINFRRKTRLVIQQANTIIAEMQAEGYTLTVRQLFYQFVSRDWLENTKQTYQRLASIVDDARKAGLIDWNAIEDRTRFLRRISTYSGPEDFLNRVIPGYAEALWANQEAYCEVWIEKDALLGVIEKTCNTWRVPYFACRGYASSSELYTAGKRLARQRANGKRVVVFHLGDHDPSGLDMTRVNRESLQEFGRTYGIEVERLALNYDQVEEYDPPPNHAKDADSRFAEYEAQFGEECWELDALNPKVINGLLVDAIKGVVDEELFNKDRAAEEANEAILGEIRDHWEDVRRYFKHRFNEHPNSSIWPETILSEVADHWEAIEAEEAENEEGEE